MFQHTRSLKNDIALFLATTAAGFRLTENKSAPTSNGAAWCASLMHGRAKIVTVTNGGYGGPNESHFHTLTAAGKGSLETLFAIAEVTSAVRRHMLSQLASEKQYDKLSDPDYAAAIADVEARVPAATKNNVEFLVSYVADTGEMISSLKRAIKTKLVVVFEGGDSKYEYVAYNIIDTPANRERVKLQEKGRNIDFFIADLFNVPTASKGA